MKAVNNLKQDINHGCTDEFINKNRGIGENLSFNEFRKYIAEKFENELKSIPGLYEDIVDYNGEGPFSVRLYHDVFTDFHYNLDSDEYSIDIEENLKDYYMHDYLINMKKKAGV